MESRKIESGLQLFSRLNQRPSLENLHPDIFDCGPCPNDFVEITGGPGTGKTLLVTDLVARCILPHDVTVGKNCGAILIDSSHHFSMFRLIEVMEFYIRSSKTQKNVKQLIETALSKLTVLNCYDYQQFEMTLRQLETLLLEDLHIGLVMIDGLSSFYWDYRNTKGIVSMQAFYKKLLESLQRHVVHANVVTGFTRTAGEVNLDSTWKIVLRETESQCKFQAAICNVNRNVQKVNEFVEMELIEAKITAMVGLGLSSMLVGLLPAWFSAHGQQQWPLLLSALMCFGSGVLMSTSLVHMLPEIREILSKHSQYAELIFCAGFFIVYIIDEAVHYFYGDAHSHGDPQGNSNALDRQVKRRHSYSYQRRAGYTPTEYEPLLYGECSYRQPPYNPNYTNSNCDNHPPSQLCHVGHQEPCAASPIGNLGLLIALCIHAVLEGLAVGLQTSSAQVLLLLGAVASHKLVVGFCLGVELASSLNSGCRHFIYIMVFSMGSVLGIGVGMAVIEVPKNVLEILFPVLQGLAAGTLLYVTLSEVLPRERARWHKQHRKRIAGAVQLVAVLLGFIIMSAITIILDEEV